MSRPAAAVHHVIKAYDVRGLVGEEIDEGFVADVGGAFARLVRGDASKVVSGHDRRSSSPSLAAAFLRVLLSFRRIPRLDRRAPIHIGRGAIAAPPHRPFSRVPPLEVFVRRPSEAVAPSRHPKAFTLKADPGRIDPAG